MNMTRGLFETPKLDDLEREVIDRIAGIRTSLQYMLSTSKRWTGLLARVTLARSIQGSNSIEGYLVSIEDAIAAVEGEQPVADPNTEVWKAVSHYQHAMTYILQLADDPYWMYDENLIRGLHYGTLAYDLSKNPGRWRPGNIHVRREATGEIVYTAPDAETVPSLMKALVDSLNVKDSEVPKMVKAAMAHLNLVMIHPFSDGNGRMARALQTLVLVREERILDKVFCSIEERLGAIRDEYYKVLAEVGTPKWNPSGDARPFVRFCLASHLYQAEMLLQYSRFMAAVWGYVEEEAKRRGFPERLHFAMADAAMRFKVRNATYRRAAGDINEHLASRDLKWLVDEGLLIAEGERRGRTYTAATPLYDIGKRARDEFPPKVTSNPFEDKK
jgi:Fic family protein